MLHQISYFNANEPYPQLSPKNELYSQLRPKIEMVGVLCTVSEVLREMAVWYDNVCEANIRNVL